MPATRLGPRDPVRQSVRINLRSRRENEPGAGVDKIPDQPSRTDPVDLRPRPGDPRPALVSFRAETQPALRRPLRLLQRFTFLQEPLHVFAA